MKNIFKKTLLFLIITLILIPFNAYASSSGIGNADTGSGTAGLSTDSNNTWSGNAQGSCENFMGE